jgi:hypothetical protein
MAGQPPPLDAPASSLCADASPALSPAPLLELPPLPEVDPPDPSSLMLAASEGPPSSLRKKSLLVPAPHAQTVAIAVNTSMPVAGKGLATRIRYLRRLFSREPRLPMGPPTQPQPGTEGCLHRGLLALDGYAKLQGAFGTTQPARRERTTVPIDGGPGTPLRERRRVRTST